jgi:uncharacterized membrane protein
VQVPVENIVILLVMTAVFGGVVLVAARQGGRRAALLSAGWAVVTLAMFAWVALHQYASEPLSTILTAVAIPAFALVAVVGGVSLFRTMRRWLSDDA